MITRDAKRRQNPPYRRPRLSPKLNPGQVGIPNGFRTRLSTENVQRLWRAAKVNVMVSNGVCGLPATMDEANVERENMSVGSIVHGGYAMMEDHAKVRGTFGLNSVNV